MILRAIFVTQMDQSADSIVFRLLRYQGMRIPKSVREMATTCDSGIVLCSSLCHQNAKPQKELHFLKRVLARLSQPKPCRYLSILGISVA